MNPYPDDTFLARWLNGDLRPEELQAFEQSPDYARLSRLMDAMQHFERHPFDQERVLSRVKAQLPMQPLPTSAPARKRVWWPYAAAIAVLFIVGTWWLTRPAAKVTPILMATGTGEQQSQTFADGTVITLNAQSELEAEILNTETPRTVRLKGEAYLKVAPGSPFEVETNLGSVRVLGTAFMVTAHDRVFRVQCYEGSVLVESPHLNRRDTLTQGEGTEVRVAQDWQMRSFQFEPDELTWLQEVSTYREVPVYEVIAGLERQFGVPIQAIGLDTTELISANFPHTNLEEALSTVFDAEELTWKFEPEIGVILKKK